MPKKAVGPSEIEQRVKSTKFVSDLVAEELLRAIAEKRLSDERRRLPSERNLAELLKVSRTSVRQALQHLQTLGVVEIGNRSRARVLDFESRAFQERLVDAAGLLLADQQFADFQEARTLFEVGLARYAASHATPEQIGQLTQALMENQRAIGDADQFIETDMRFHEVLAAMPGNPIFVAIHHAIVKWKRSLRAQFLTMSATYEEAYKAHQAIVLAIIARDPEQAAECMTDHLLRVTGNIMGTTSP